MSEKLNLYEKIQAVSNDVKNIEKDMVVGTGNNSYKAASDLAVTLAIKKAETKHRLVSIPQTQKVIQSETLKTIKNYNGQIIEGYKFVENIEMTTRIVDLDDITKFIDIVSLAKGVDTADKGFGKAATYARKYALLNAYKIPTGEDPDANKSEEIQTAKTIDDKTIAITNYFNNNITKLQAVLMHFNVGTLEDLNEKQIETVYNNYKSKKLI